MAVALLRHVLSSIPRQAQACLDMHGGHFEHLTICKYSRTPFIRTFIIRSVKYPDQFFLSTTCSVYEYVFEQCNYQQLFRMKPKLMGIPKPPSRKSSREVSGRRREEGGPWPPPGFLPLNCDGTEQNHTVTCTVLKFKANDRRKNSSLSRNEFRGPRSDFVRHWSLQQPTRTTIRVISYSTTAV
ncbi:hypothetical protein TNCV_3939101 [Trichonephila clavipes]|nr:hypothetical protein TNCV_3939101 [Trichonephila clavipes]